MSRFRFIGISLLMLGSFVLAALTAQAMYPRGGKLTLIVVDADSGEQVPCRIHLKGQTGGALKVPKLPFWKDHFVFPGKITLELPRGNYTFEISRGPEFVTRSGYFTINDFADDEKIVDLKRAVNMTDESWWSGDLHVHRPLKDMELLMQAEDLHIAPDITWWNKKNEWEKLKIPEKTVLQFPGQRYCDQMAGEDERGGGALLFFRMKQPMQITRADREYPSSVTFLNQAKEDPQVWVDAEKPFWWDFPLWLASGKIDSIGVVNNHLWRTGVGNTEAWGKPRDKQAYPDPEGNNRWSQDIYYHVLNCGLRIPPSAGSASGVLPNPVGYNRMYVWVDKDAFSNDAWWKSFKEGRVVVTNGPLIRPLADGRLPGHVFKGPAGGELEIDVMMNLSLAASEKISYLEIINNGAVTNSIRFEDWAKTGHFPPLRCRESGWLLVRAVTDNATTYRLALSAPWYVEIGDSPTRISKKSAQFFLNWTNERAAQIKLEDPKQQAEVQSHWDAARKYWEVMVAKANAE